MNRIAIRYEIRKRIEKFQLWAAWHLPRWLVYWATIRAVSHGTSGEYGNTVVPDVPAMTILQRWERK